MSLPTSPQGPPDQTIDSPEESLVEDLLRAVDDDLPEGDEIEIEVERLQSDISMLQRLASSTSAATRAKCEEVAVKLRYRAVKILDQALKGEDGEETLAPGETSETDEYFIGALDYGPNDPAGRRQYVGAILHETRLGLGSMRWTDGTCYQGEWSHDKSNGYGVEVYTDGSMYKGQFFEDQRSGLGSWMDPSGTRYVGHFREGEKHGTGVVMKRVGDGFKCALCTFENGQVTGKEMIAESDPRCIDILERAEPVVQDATQMAEAAKRLEAEVVVRPQTPRKRIDQPATTIPTISPAEEESAPSNPSSPSKSESAEKARDPFQAPIQLYKPEDLVVKRDRWRLRMRGRGSGRRGGMTRGGSHSAQSRRADETADAEQAEHGEQKADAQETDAQGDVAVEEGGGEEKTKQSTAAEAGEESEKTGEGNDDGEGEAVAGRDTPAEETAAAEEEAVASGGGGEGGTQGAEDATGVEETEAVTVATDKEETSGDGVGAAAEETPAGPQSGSRPDDGSEMFRSVCASLLQARVRSCPRSTLFRTAEGVAEATQFGLVWPRRFGPEVRVLREAAQRLQGAARRVLGDAAGARERAGEAVWGACRRSVAERRYRLLLHRPNLQADTPGAMRRRLFLRTEAMDRLDAATAAGWMALYWRMETDYHELRHCQKLLSTTTEDRAEMTKYEARLHHDIERGGGGGLVRQLGGPKAAKKKLAEVQAHLEELGALQTKETDTQRRLEKEIKWLYEGHLDSLLAQEELVEEGHIRCAPGECVTVASRYRSDKRLGELSEDVGQLGERHSEGSRWVHFDLLDRKDGLAAGGEGIYHLQYSTELERRRLMLRLQEDEMEERRRAEEAQRMKEERELGSRGPRSLSYNRNPVRCWYNVPLSQFVQSTDLRFAAYALNHAAQDGDERNRPLSKTQVNSITAQCSGKEPFTFTWRPKWPALELPLGLELDPRTGEVTGTPHFEGEVVCYVKCSDPDGFYTTTELRFLGTRPEGPVAVQEVPMTVQEIEEQESLGSSAARP